MNFVSQDTFAAAIALACQHAATGRFGAFLSQCQQAIATQPDDAALWLEVGALYATYGFLADAGACYQRAQALAPVDLRTTINLANLARDAGDHAEARQRYAQLLQVLPDYPVIRRNALTSLEYDPEVSDAQRFAQAKDWGVWAIARAGGPFPRPTLVPLEGRPLRVGYVSADLCQHTVGLLVKGVLRAHDPARVQVFAYSAGTVSGQQ